MSRGFEDIRGSYYEQEYTQFAAVDDKVRGKKARARSHVLARETFFLSSRRGRAILIDSSLDNGGLLRGL